jgi:hypothetical protein
VILDCNSVVKLSILLITKYEFDPSVELVEMKFLFKSGFGEMVKSKNGEFKTLYVVN